MIGPGVLIEYDAPIGTDRALMMRRGPLLISAAINLGARDGCRIVDDAYALDFKWRPKRS